MKLVIYQDEAFPVYTLSLEEDDTVMGWVPAETLPLEILSEDEVKDYQRVEALYGAWQDRLKMLYRANARHD